MPDDYVIQLTKVPKNIDPAMWTGPIADVVEQATEVGYDSIQRWKPDIGAVAGSFQKEAQPLQGRVFSNSLAAVVHNVGRRPGRKPPPASVLSGWAARHGFKGSLFVLARAIGKRGIKGRFFMWRAMHDVDRALPNLLRQAAGEIAQKWGQQE